MFPVGMKMTSPSARFPQSGSFTAGLLIGWSIAAAALALTETTSVAWQARLVFGAPVILFLGLALQVLVSGGDTAHDGRQRKDCVRKVACGGRRKSSSRPARGNGVHAKRARPGRGKKSGRKTSPGRAVCPTRRRRADDGTSHRYQDLRTALSRTDASVLRGPAARQLSIAT
jgi:hypothetical protein